MTLQHLCFDPRGPVYIAVTDVGVFAVPPRAGGWAQRKPRPHNHNMICKPVGDVVALAQFLGMVPAPAPGPRMGGCNCRGRRT